VKLNVKVLIKLL